jgi:hypothetical protein
MTVPSIEYPYWLMIVGILLFLLGRVGLALRQRSVDADPLANAADQEPSERDADVNEVDAYNRIANEKRKERWERKESLVLIRSGREIR